MCIQKRSLQKYKTAFSQEKEEKYKTAANQGKGEFIPLSLRLSTKQVGINFMRHATYETEINLLAMAS